MLEGLPHNSPNPEFWMNFDNVMYYIAYAASGIGLAISAYAWWKVRKVGYALFALYFLAPFAADTIGMIHNEAMEAQLEKDVEAWEEQITNQGIQIVHGFRIPILEIILPIAVFFLWIKDSANQAVQATSANAPVA